MLTAKKITCMLTDKMIIIAKKGLEKIDNIGTLNPGMGEYIPGGSERKLVTSELGNG